MLHNATQLTAEEAKPLNRLFNTIITHDTETVLKYAMGAHYIVLFLHILEEENLLHLGSYSTNKDSPL